MTVRELIEKLQALPEEQKDRRVLISSAYYHDDATAWDIGSIEPTSPHDYRVNEFTDEVAVLLVE